MGNQEKELEGSIFWNIPEVIKAVKGTQISFWICAVKEDLTVLSAV